MSSFPNNYDTAYSREPPLPNVSNVLALYLTFRRCFRLVTILPVLTAISPLIVNITFSIMDRLSGNHSILSLLLTIGLTLSFRNFVWWSAPSRKMAEESLAKTQTWFPIALFWISATACRWIGKWIGGGDPIGKSAMLSSWTPRIDVGDAFRLALGMVWMGFAVALRYVGPSSVVRCSSCPLMSHPFTITLHTLWERLTSVDALLEYIARPSESPGELISNPFRILQDNCRRLKAPTWQTYFIQFVVTGMFAGALVAYTSVLPFFASNQHYHQQSSLWQVGLVVNCIFISQLNLYVTTLDGVSHELNPKRCTALNMIAKSNMPYFQRNLSLRLKPYIRITIMYLIAAIAVFVVTIVFYQQESLQDLWKLFGACAVTALLMNTYLFSVDELHRLSLCTPSGNLMSLIEEVADDQGMDTCLDAFLYSILHNDSSLVKQIASPPKKNPRFLDMETEEKNRNAMAIRTFANTLLRSEKNDPFRAPLEEDILRLEILESLGGGASFEETSKSTLEGATDRHIENIKYWVQPSENKLNVGVRTEPLAVPLVRALCAYLGGMGKALDICATNMHRLSSVAHDTWQLPPGAIVCCEYAIQAATRCIIWNFSTSSIAHADWRSTHLSMLTPVVLMSLYHLSYGIKKYSQIGKRSTNLEIPHIIKRDRPELLSLFQTCSGSALAILLELKSLEGVQSINLDLEGECQSWTRELLANRS